MTARHDPKTPIVTHFGTLVIGEHTADCGVTDDGRRVLLSRRFGSFLGYKGNATRIHGGLNFPTFMRRKGVSKHLDSVLSDASNRPFWVDVQQDRGRVNRAVAYPAEILPDICLGFVRAQMAGDLHGSQLHIARRCLEVVEALTAVAIVALVDEATGYQREREAGELQALLLERLVSPERQEWVKRYNDEFYCQVYRLYGLDGDPLSHHRPGRVGTLTNFIVYDRLAPGLTDELQRLNEDRGAKHHQYLSDEGLREWEDHMRLVMALMRRSVDRCDFEDKIALVAPRSAEQMRLRFQAIAAAERSGPRLH